MKQIPKLCGADIELGNFILGRNLPNGSGWEASRLLLKYMPGLSPKNFIASYQSGWSGQGAKSSSYNPQDWGRKWIPTNGSCVYIDLDHLELCLPEVLSAYDYVAVWRAMLKMTQTACSRANEDLTSGEKLQVLVNNSDGLGHSYGSHLNILMTREAWDTLFDLKLHYLLYLASFQISSIVLTGQGKVGAENGEGAIPFQLAQRADFFETLHGHQTTYHRPIVNSRDESLCGSSWTDEQNRGLPPMARLHCIFFDNTLSQTATLLKVGLMQMVVAMIEADAVNTHLILEEPLAALKRWSRDPSLQTKASLLSGKQMTIVELQKQFLEEARKFDDKGGFNGYVLRADELLNLWEDTLNKLEARDFPSLGTRLDWVLKYSILQQALAHSPKLNWYSPEIKHLDHLYSSLDRRDGLFWAVESSGLLEQPILSSDIAAFETQPPESTRAYTRAKILQKLAQSEWALEQADWDSLRLRPKSRRGWWEPPRTLPLPNPLSHTKSEVEPVLNQGSCLDEVLTKLGAEPLWSASPALSRNEIQDSRYEWKAHGDYTFLDRRTYETDA